MYVKPWHPELAPGTQEFYPELAMEMRVLPQVISVFS